MLESEDTHPGFTIQCKNCGSYDVYVDNSLGFSAMSGSWGSVDLVCNNCDLRVDIVQV